jgi:hypothetical protein
MIRRGFWLVAGATLGISGYRRASRVARSLGPAARSLTSAGRAPAAGRILPRPDLTTRRILAGAAAAGRSTAEGAAFVRDVREGMAEYLDRRVDETGRTLESQRGRSAPGSQRRRAAPRRPQS